MIFKKQKTRWSAIEALYSRIRDLGIKFNADKIVLYGSRARGNNRERSDIDIAVFGIDRTAQVSFMGAVEELPTLLDFDVVFVSDNTSQALMENIEKDGIVLMNKADEKLGKLINAAERLNEALNEYEKNQSDVIRDGAIQRFEFCTELAWKATREYLLNQGYTEINSPKSVMKQAYADHVIDDEAAWLALLNDRNLTSHIYDDNTAAEIFRHVHTVYPPLFNALIKKLSAE